MMLKRVKIQIFYDREGMPPKILKSAEARNLAPRLVLAVVDLVEAFWRAIFSGSFEFL